MADFICSGAVHPGEKLPSIRAIAEKYNSNTTTVSKVVAVLATEGIVTRRRGSGIYCAPDAHKQIARMASPSRKIGLIVHDIEETIGHRLLTGVEAVVTSRHASLEIAHSYHDAELERRNLEAMRDRGVEGVVLKVAPNRNEADEYLSRELRDFPIVIVDDYRAAMKRPSVIFDNFAAGYEMTRHLIRCGCNRIAFFYFDGHYKVQEERLAGYRAALREFQMPQSPELVIKRGALIDLRKQSHDSVLSAVADWLSLDPRPDAIIAPMDYCAALFIDYIAHHAPEEAGRMLVTGFDNDRGSVAHWFGTDSPAWPTTRPDFRRMGSRAAEVLFEMIESGSGADEREIQIVLPCPLLLPQDSEAVRPRLIPSGAAQS